MGVHFYGPYSFFKHFQPAQDPARTSLGILWHIKDNFLLTSEIAKSINFPVNYKLGLELSHKDLLFLRTGLQTFPLTHTVGAGIQYERYNMDFAAVHHQVLGFSPAISFHYEFE